MSKYIDLVREALDIMECHLDQSVTLQYICDELYMSPFHFNRVFTAITGISPKKYMLSRTLSLAADDLIKTDESIIAIAMKWGFNYSEDFSRSFKRQFKISPSNYRSNKGHGATCFIQEPIRAISYREFINRSGSLELKVTIKSVDAIYLLGTSTLVSTYENRHLEILDDMTKRFIKASDENVHLQKTAIYSLVKCEEEGDDLYDVYIGRQLIYGYNEPCDMKARVIPEGMYACFEYAGKTNQVYEDFERDFYNWVVKKEIILKNIGINMISKYAYKNNQLLLDEILVPVASVIL